MKKRKTLKADEAEKMLEKANAPKAAKKQGLSAAKMYAAKKGK